MSDTKNGWLEEDGWKKMSRNVKSKYNTNIETHYIKNTVTGKYADFKFID